MEQKEAESRGWRQDVSGKDGQTPTREVAGAEKISLKKAQMLRGKDKCAQVGKRIRALREKQGITQNALAKKIFLNKSYLSQIENGKANLTLSTLSIIADGLGVELQLLFEFEDENIYNLEYIISKVHRLSPERRVLAGKILDCIWI